MLSQSRKYLHASGYTLIEAMLVVAVLGILLSLAAPQLAAPLDVLAVEGVAQRIAGAHARARATALVSSRVALLTIAADSLALRTTDGVDTAIVWADSGPAADRVALAGPTRTVLFAPTGWTFGLANGAYHLSRGTARRDVIVSRMGRVRIVR
jgi:prepilin-type N-terminal cleavage/methylation domain-containing protein